MTQQSKPILSIIITSYTMNRFKDICELFDSIKSQTLLNQSTVISPQSAIPLPQSLEVIFVAERSRELYEKIKEFISQQLAVKNSTTSSPSPQSQNLVTLNFGPSTYKLIFNDGEPGLSAARNLGIKHASGEIIAFIDDDALPFPDWAEQMIKSYEDDSIIGVTGPAFPLWEDESMSWFPEEFYQIISCTAWSGWNEERIGSSDESRGN